VPKREKANLLHAGNILLFEFVCDRRRAVRGDDDYLITSSAMTSAVCYTARPSDFVVVATARRSFTFFEAFSINFAIVVYFECMQDDLH
jgi:hypothetical protein